MSLCIITVDGPMVGSHVNSRNTITSNKQKRLSVIDGKILSASGGVRRPFSTRMLIAFRHQQKASSCQRPT